MKKKESSTEVRVESNATVRMDSEKGESNAAVRTEKGNEDLSPKRD